jgi:phosphoribosyl 1,2-cyclic phosphodiesterase
MLRFLSFGSGSSGNCYYLASDTHEILIDVGIGIRTLKKHFREYGLSISKINEILITHDHADHVKSVGSLSGEYNIPVYSTVDVHSGIGKNFCVKRKITPENKKCVEKDESFCLGNFRITPFDVPHDSTDNVGYKIECDGVVFCIITDAGHVTEKMEQYIGQANYLVIESNYDEEMLRNGTYPKYLKDRISGGNGHLCNSECGKALAEHATDELRHVWLCHLSGENNHPILAQKTVEQVLRSYGLIAGKDFELDVLRRSTPSEMFELI